MESGEERGEGAEADQAVFRGRSFGGGKVQLKDQAEGERGQERNRKRKPGSPSQGSPASRRARILPCSFGDQ